MAKKADADDNAKTNTYEPERALKIIKKIEDEREGLISEKMSYAARCKPYHERINQAFEEAKGFGIKKKALKEMLQKRSLERKLECVAAELEDDDLESFEQLEQALGSLADLPLGQAAISKAAGKEGKGGNRRRAPSPAAAEDDERDVRPRHLQENDAQRVADANAKALESGISQLN